MNQEFITIGRILAPRGIKGELRVEVDTDFPQRFSPSSEVYIDRRPMMIESSVWKNGQAIIKLGGINSVEEAEKLRGQAVEIRYGQVYPLPEGQYYHFQLIGLEVRTIQGEVLGNITEILTAPANDNYVVSGVGGEILIPAIEDVVKSVDLEKGCLVVEPIDGLLDLNKKAGS